MKSIIYTLKFKKMHQCRPGVGNLSLVAGQKQNLQCMASCTNFPPKNLVPLLFIMLKLGNLGNFYQIRS